MPCSASIVCHVYSHTVLQPFVIVGPLSFQMNIDNLLFVCRCIWLLSLCTHSVRRGECMQAMLIRLNMKFRSFHFGSYLSDGQYKPQYRSRREKWTLTLRRNRNDVSLSYSAEKHNTGRCAVCYLLHTTRGVSTPQLDRWHYNIKSLPAQMCRNGNSWAWSSAGLSARLRPLRKECQEKCVLISCRWKTHHFPHYKTNRSGAISSVLSESLKRAEEHHWVKTKGVRYCVCVEKENEHKTASERLIGLLAVYMPNKVLLHDGNSS